MSYRTITRTTSDPTVAAYLPVGDQATTAFVRGFEDGFAICAAHAEGALRRPDEQLNHDPDYRRGLGAGRAVFREQFWGERDNGHHLLASNNVESATITATTAGGRALTLEAVRQPDDRDQFDITLKISGRVAATTTVDTGWMDFPGSITLALSVAVSAFTRHVHVLAFPEQVQGESAASVRALYTREQALLLSSCALSPTTTDLADLAMAVDVYRAGLCPTTVVLNES